MQNRSDQLVKLREELKISKRRKSYFEKELRNEDSAGYASARARLLEETDEIANLKCKIGRLEVQSPFRELPYVLFATTVVFSLSYLVGAKVEASEVWREHPRAISIGDWAIPYAAIVGLIFFCHNIEGFLTNILPNEKDRFTWTSFCISPAAYSLVRVYFLGLHIGGGYALTVFYCLGEREMTPLSRFDLNHSDGCCGMRSYLRFVESWVVVGLVAGFLPLLLVLKITVYPGFNPAYLLTPSFELLVMGVIVARLIRNVYVIRKKYEEEVAMLGPVSEQKSRGVVPDPTLDVIGKQWWKLPGSIGAFLVVFWMLLSFADVKDALDTVFSN